MKTYRNACIYFFVALICIILLSFYANRIIIYKCALLSIDSNINKLVLGDSKAQCAINPSKACNLINVANSADSYFYSYIKLREIASNNPAIDTVYLSLSYYNITKYIENRWVKNSSHIQKKFPTFCCYFNLDDLYTLAKLNPSAVIQSFVSIPKYSLKLVCNVLTNKKDIKFLGIGGFEKLTANNLEWDINRILNEKKEVRLEKSEIEISYLLKICNYCSKNGIELIFFNTPSTYVYLKSISSSEQLMLRNFYNENLNDFQYLDYSTLSFPDSCFSDAVHLNAKGADAFTKILIAKPHYNF
jgi:hypothetical protein